MSANTTIRTLRAQAWNRAVGELKAVLVTYWDDDADQYRKMKVAIDDFVKIVKDEGLAE